MKRIGTRTKMRMWKNRELAGFARWARLYRDMMGEGSVGHETRPARLEGVCIHSVPVAVTGGRGEARE